MVMALSGTLILAPCLYLAYQLCVCFYNFFLHPLRRYPGPTLAAISVFPKIRKALAGQEIQWIVRLHEQHGDVVRVSPNELSFAGANAFKDIYGHRRSAQAPLVKDPKFYFTPGDDDINIVNSNDQDHARQRRIFAHAFSDKALKMQEPLFLTYVNKLIDNIRKRTSTNPGQRIDMVRQYNYTTFDVMGDLTFGESLHMLEDSGYHPWVEAMVSNFKIGTMIHSLRHFPTIEKLLLMLVPPSLKEKQRMHNKFSVARVDRRLEKKDARPDIWGLVLEKEGHDGALSRREMYANCNIFMMAGTETTATLLSGLTYYLSASPAKLARLTNEIRSTFQDETEITIERLQALPYLHACIEEGLRMYPPVSNGLPRIVPAGGVTIEGHEVPAGTKVYTTHLAVYRNAENFRHPYTFFPERWLPREYPEARPFVNDRKGALQPFSFGPRSCLGKNMAYHEIRIILSKVLWNFDLELCAESQDWNDQKIFIMWDKHELLCQLRPVRR
ncbi:cytochrome P450 [Teratosphaeria nubilosa]|uniref:Cytochrome P450 n=1 Tax=Teratosphaeria nubilosa TaxID=161662 RepID=A0A6G1L6J4_9PEZI|nr:cytochrome P450 [Teratosphaeria nubilosa]